MNRKNILLLCIVVLSGLFLWNLRDKKIVILPRGTLTSLKGEKIKISNEVLNLQDAFIRVAEKVKPAVVNISTEQMIAYPQYEFFFGDPFEDFFEDFFGKPFHKPKKRYHRYKAESGGSGVIIDPKGYIITNEHVVHNADRITVTVNISGEKKKYDGKVVGKDIKTDIAVIKITAKDLPVVVLGDSDDLAVGQWVVAIGSPFGLEQTVTSGIISAMRQSIVVENREYKDFIQTDAAINKGNSGGPLCNISGEVIGINTAIFAPTGVFAGIGFAIPINRAKEILDDLIHKGKVVRGWLGIEIKPVDDAIARQFNLPDKEGALVNSVIKNSPAEKGGLKRGDVIREFNGKKIKTIHELQSIVATTGPQKKNQIKIFRNGKEQVLYVTTGEMPEEFSGGEVPEEKEATANWLGIKVNNLTDRLIQEYQIPEGEKGVVITSIEPDSKALEMGLNEGDLIKAINQKETPDVETFNKITKKLNLKDGVLFDIIRQGKPIYISYME